MKINEVKVSLQQKFQRFTKQSIDDAIQHSKKEIKRVLNNTTSETKDKIFCVATLGLFSFMVLDGMMGGKVSKSVRTGNDVEDILSGAVFNITYTENNTYNYYGEVK